MKLQACADKLNNEIETYGNPPNFPSKEEVSARTTSHVCMPFLEAILMSIQQTLPSSSFVPFPVWKP